MMNKILQPRCKLHLKAKLFILNTLLKIKDLMLTFLNAKEIAEYDHEYRDPKYERSRQLMIVSHGTTVIRTNPDAVDFNINRLINQIYMHIIKSIKK